MGYLVIALAVGVALGLLAGGRPAHAGLRPIQGLGALVAALLLQLLPAVVDLSDGSELTCVIASYVLLVGFGVLNVRLVGMPVVLVGLVLNLLVITVNGGMPVRADAIRTVDPGVDIATLDLGAKRQLEDDDTRLAVLGDIIPVTPLGQVLSFGDLVLAVGLADVAFRLLKPVALPRRRRPTVAEALALLPAGA